MNDLRNLRVGLLGANGFIGSAILKALIRSGTATLALCGPSTSTNPHQIPDGVECLECDLTAVKDLARVVSELNVVIHAAGPPSVRRSFEIPEQYVRVHVEGTVAVLRACREANVSRLIYISSAEVYGRPEISPVPEHHRFQARSPYAAAKIGAEKMIEAYAQSFGLKAVILRPFSVYGPNPTADSLLGAIIAMANGGSISLQDLRPIRDYCYIEDLAGAVLRACCLQTGAPEAFNIGTGKGTSVADFAAVVLRSMGLDVPVVGQNSGSRPQQSEILELIADISKARNVLGWNPEIGIEEGVRRAVALDRSVA